MAAGPGHALILADGDPPDAAALDRAWPVWSDGIDLIVAADGGAAYAASLDLGPIDLWVGDGDSLAPAALEALRRSGVPVELAASDKDESDTELAVLAAIDRGATRLTILGAFGGPRLDHALANVLLLGHRRLIDRTTVLLSSTVRLRLIRAPGPDGGPASLSLSGRPGDLVSLLPFAGPAGGVTTSGLQYALRDETLEVGPARGLSNVRLEPTAMVSLKVGSLLVVETPVTLSE
ncbi:MAG TPA: thiamine diphosphokinase [Methylomirabilota bacterium]|nr:thiamine diphosphokinase [Methylomirabilota bacterium]